MEVFESQPVVFRPDPASVDASRLAQFMAKWRVNGLDALRDRSAHDPAWFWDAVVKDLEWPFVEPYREVLDLSRGPEWPTWFEGGLTNVALACLDRHLERGLGQKVALIHEAEEGTRSEWTYEKLSRETSRLAWGLEDLGVGQGDRVAVFLPMIPEAVVTMLALAKLGAIFLPIFSGYGAEAMATRLHDAEARIVITADGFYRRGRVVAMSEVAQAAVAKAATVSHVVVVERIGMKTASWSAHEVAWDELLSRAPGIPFPSKPWPSETPLMIIYTSGTTGRPKGAVHTHTGFPLKATQDLWHAFDLKEDDTFFWFTDLGWMMGPWMVYGGLATGTTLVLYDGTPDFPDPARLWRIIDRNRVTVFGISPTAVRGLMAHGDEPLEGVSLESLRILGSSGEPWNPAPWQWFFERVGKSRCPIINYSGGTEISGGIVSALATEPQKPCAFNGPIPGMAAVVLDESGSAVTEQVGELAILAPWPGMTRGFWRDPERYRQSYWDRYPGTWVHGDFAYVDQDGFWYILGRSDDTIKVAGKRLGPAEVESALVGHPDVVEAAAVGVPDAIKGEALVCFVVLNGEARDLVNMPEILKARVAETLGRPLAPAQVYLVDELPKTRNGKVVRRAIRASYLGLDPGDISSLENPSALAAMRGFGGHDEGGFDEK